jgi:hypothetical protein
MKAVKGTAPGTERFRQAKRVKAAATRAATNNIEM